MGILAQHTGHPSPVVGKGVLPYMPHRTCIKKDVFYAHAS